jgi:uncharacterized membrane protein
MDKKIAGYGLLLLCAIISVIFVNNNERFYHRTIAKVTEVREYENTSSDIENQSAVFDQKLTVRILNGGDIGKTLELDNQYTKTGAYDYRYQRGDKLFLTLTVTEQQQLSGAITGVKRDQYLVLTAWLFLIFIILIGKKKGLLSALSLAVNVVIFYYALDIYRNGMNLLLLCSIIAVLFTAFSMLMVLGNNRKAYSAIISVIAATFSTMLISYAVMLVTNENGMRYEEMQFITRPIFPIFISEILLGSLGAIMDIAITISSSIYELYDSNVTDKKALIASGMQIGRDIMGTMCNILLLAYVSGSVPMILLYIKNGMPVWNAFYTNLSLELVRALTGSIGIVLAIPISLHISIFLLHKRAKGLSS